jgi:transposase
MAGYGRAKKSLPAINWVPAARAKTITQVGAIRMDGPVVMRGSLQAMNTRRFLSFMKNHLLPRLRPADVLVLDNLSAHKHPTVRRLARQWDVRIIYLPPSTSKFNPIEQVWAWMKQKFRRRVNRAKQCFRYAISGAWRKTYSLCFASFFKHCGYLKSSHEIWTILASKQESLSLDTLFSSSCAGPENQNLDWKPDRNLIPSSLGV